MGSGAGEDSERMQLVSQSDTQQWEGDRLNTCRLMFRKAKGVLNRES